MCYINIIPGFNINWTSPVKISSTFIRRFLWEVNFIQVRCDFYAFIHLRQLFFYDRASSEYIQMFDDF